MKARKKELMASGKFKPKGDEGKGAKESKPKPSETNKAQKKRKNETNNTSVQPPAKRAKGTSEKNLVFPVLVRGLGEVSVADLQDVFSECGETKSIKISGHGKAIITFSGRDAAAMALKLHGTEMDGGIIKVSKLSPEEARADAAAAAPAEPDDGFSLSVCINQVPDEATVEEIQTACENFGEVVKVKKDKKRSNVAFCEFASKVSARLATKRCVRIGRTLCKTVHLKTASIETGEAKATPSSQPDAVEGKDKEAGLTVLAKGMPEGVTVTEVREFFKECGEPADVRIGGSGGRALVFVDFPTKTSFRKAMRLKSPKMAGNVVLLTPAKKVSDKGAEKGAKSQQPRTRPASCRTIIVKNLAYGAPGETEQKIKSKIARVFKVCGTVKEVRLFMDKGQLSCEPKRRALVA